MRNLDAATIRYLVPVIGMNVHDMEILQQLVKAGAVVPEHIWIEKQVQVVELNDDDPELIQQAVGEVQQNLIFEAFDVHLEDHIALVVPQMPLFPACKRREDLVFGGPEILFSRNRTPDALKEAP